MGLAVRIDSKAHRAPGGGGMRPVLHDVAFTAGPGEVLALFGPSGTGKSTTLRIVMGLDDAYLGVVRRPEGRLGAMFQEPRLLPWMTVGDNLRLVRPEADYDPAPALAAVGLAGTAGLLPGALSLGMARRAALARALAVDPTLLVLDEPFASLDPQTSRSLRTLIADRAATHGTTVLFSTHEIDHAVACADRLLVLDGSPATLAADMTLPRDDAAAREAARARLCAAFPFLAPLASADASA